MESKSSSVWKAEAWSAAGELVYGVLLLATGAIVAWAVRDERAKTDARLKSERNDFNAVAHELHEKRAEVAALRQELGAAVIRAAKLQGAIAELRGELLAELDAEDAEKAAEASQRSNGVKVEAPTEARHG
jgi:hypothetical protein